jgi:predicted NACHT family NTPase
MAAIPCLILLGEPGLGKSRELGQQHTFTHDQVGEAVLWCDFSAFQEQGLLARAIFDNARFQEWVRGTHRIYLFLDGLDEGLLSIPTLACYLSVEFANYSDHLARLSLRITCRTAEWPSHLEDQLRELWGNRNVRAFRLAPLRRDDVSAAARIHELNADRFLQEDDYNNQDSYPMLLYYLPP